MGGQIFFNPTPSKNFKGAIGMGGKGHQLGTIRLNIVSREKLSAPTLA